MSSTTAISLANEGDAAVLADTGPLYAIVDRTDQYHRRAQEDLHRLEQEGITVVVAAPILLETYTLVLRQMGIGRAHTWLREMISAATLINPILQDYLLATETIRRYVDQPLTLFDAVLARISGRLQYPVWTYDHHFEVMRALVWR